MYLKAIQLINFKKKLYLSQMDQYFDFNIISPETYLFRRGGAMS